MIRVSISFPRLLLDDIDATPSFTIFWHFFILFVFLSFTVTILAHPFSTTFSLRIATSHPLASSAAATTVPGILNWSPHLGISFTYVIYPSFALSAVIVTVYPDCTFIYS